MSVVLPSRAVPIATKPDGPADKLLPEWEAAEFLEYLINSRAEELIRVRRINVLFGLGSA
ncbi:MAG: hypothetical protein ACYC0F_18110 [Rhodanobacter sp.]